MLGNAPMPLRQDVELLSALLQKHGLALMHCTLRDNRSLVLDAVKQNGGAFAYADPSLRADRGLALEAVKRSGLALQFASETLRHDKELVMQAVEHCGFALQFVPEKLRADVEIALKAVRQNGDALKLLPKELRANQKLVLEALKSGPPPSIKVDELGDAEVEAQLEALGSPLRHADVQLRSDRRVVLEAVKQDGSALFFADDALKDERALVQQALRRSGWALRFASERLKKDRSLVLEAIQSEGVAIRFAAEELRQNHSFVCEAMSRNGDALRYVDDEFHSDPKVVRSAVRQNGMALRFAATKNTPKAFAFACGPLKWDRALVLEMLQLDGSLLQHLPQELRCDRDVVTTAVQQHGRAILWASGSLKQDVSVAVEAVKQDGTALQVVSEVLKSFRNIALEAVRQNSDAWQFVDKHLRGDVDFAIAVVQNNPEVAEVAAEELEVPVKCLVAVADQADLRFDKEAMLKMIRESGWQCMRLVGSTIRQEPELHTEAVAQSWKSLKWMQEPKVTVILSACRQDLSAVELLGNVEDGIKAVIAMNHPEVVQFPSFATKLPMLSAVRKNGLLLQFASAQLREDFEVVDAAVKQNPEALRFARGATVAKLKVQQEASTAPPMLVAPAAATQQAHLLPWMAGRQDASSSIEWCCCAGEDERPLQQL